MIIVPSQNVGMARAAIATLRARVRPWLDTTLPKGAACVEIALADGRVVSETVRHARGSLDKPMSDEILVDSVFRIFAARAAAELERKAIMARLAARFA